MPEVVARKPEPPFMDSKAWLALGPEDRLLHWITYRRSYEDALAFAGITDAPEWEDLTHTQREAVRQEVMRYTQELNDTFSKEKLTCR